MFTHNHTNEAEGVEEVACNHLPTLVFQDHLKRHGLSTDYSTERQVA
jgi:hypothetical protein